jgi:DNA-binding response OmpR family regulator
MNAQSLHCKIEGPSGAAEPRVLLLEDDPLVGRSIVRLLRRHGIAITLVPNASEIAELTGQFDVGIFDIDLPGQNGVDVAVQCHAQSLVGAILFFSATSDTQRIAAAKELGEFIDKGDGTALLVERVLGLCKRDSGVYENCCALSE